VVREGTQGTRTIEHAGRPDCVRRVRQLRALTSTVTAPRPREVGGIGIGEYCVDDKMVVEASFSGYRKNVIQKRGLRNGLPTKSIEKFLPPSYTVFGNSYPSVCNREETD
jgi:hypothetical protein